MSRLIERLQKGPVICGEGYVFELERRGYLQAGAFVPEVLIDHPEVVLQLHRDFVHAGSDVVEALTYYAHRDKLKMIGKEDKLEEMNRIALRLAKQVATEKGNDCLVAGNICNTNLWEGQITQEKLNYIESIFREQVKWAKEEGVDFIIAETFGCFREALLALKVIKEAGLTAVVTLSFQRDGDKTVIDGVSFEESFLTLKKEGADVVGINCHRGPQTILPLIAKLRKLVEGPIAALPVPYRTTNEQPSFMSLKDDLCLSPHGRPFPTALDPFVCTRYEIAEFTKKAKEMGVNYFGLCCGAGPHHLRSMAEALGKKPPASKYSPNMALHFNLGTDHRLLKSNLDDLHKY
eukprot:TRINITY_DN919_c0_g1_i2.p1 TRINITY_DN919_c0_g1~~TRINITY_DN919_c0_g1_i2.p1  ORF type:complete len:349 (+),score=52.78 TRINITY_DN919_c0_g1_i2:82-1128(+)